MKKWNSLTYPFLTADTKFMILNGKNPIVSEPFLNLNFF